MQQRVLLTGGSGFIGRNILESNLSKKYQFIAPKKSELDLSSQVSVDNFFTNTRVNIIIHCACKPGHRNAKDQSNLLSTNLGMFFNLLRHQDKYTKFINIGSGAVYDMRHYQIKMKEEHIGVHIPVDDLGLYKYIINQQIKHLDDFIDLRVFGIFGKYEDYMIRFISNVVCRVIHDLPITLRQNRKFDYVYIDDLMPILDFFISNKCMHKAYNVTPDSSIELLQLANLVKQISGKSNLPIQVAESGLGTEYSGDNHLLKQEYTSLKFTPIKDSVEQLYRWYENNISSIDKSGLLIE